MTLMCSPDPTWCAVCERASMIVRARVCVCAEGRISVFNRSQWLGGRTQTKKIVVIYVRSIERIYLRSSALY